MHKIQFAAELLHFYSKVDFPEKVVQWGNLLPANKKCNITKGAHNVLEEPIITPFIDHPGDHLYVAGYRFFAKTELGRRTIDVVGLNDRMHFVTPRARIGAAFSDRLHTLFTLIQGQDKDDEKLIIMIGKLKRLMNQATRQNEYSATMSTVILSDANFLSLEATIIKFGFWDEELQNLKDELVFCSLPGKR